jgi:hypothetical protein
MKGSGQPGKQAGGQEGGQEGGHSSVVQTGGQAGRREGEWAGRRTGRRPDRQASGWVACHQMPLLLSTMVGTGGRLAANTLTPSFKPRRPICNGLNRLSFCRRCYADQPAASSNSRFLSRILGLVVRRFINAVPVLSVFFKLCCSPHISMNGV